MSNDIHDVRRVYLPDLYDDTTIVVPPATDIEPVEWREISSTECLLNNPALPFTVKYPVFDPNDFPVRLRGLIPPEDFFFVDHSNLLFGIIRDLVQGDTPILWGEPGTGKSVAFEKVASMMRVPFQRFHLNEFSDPEIFTGHHELVPGQTKYVVGSWIEMLGVPSLPVCEEWNAASEGVRFVTRPIIDGHARVTIEANQGETYMRHEWCMIGATGNPDWSARNTGVVPLAEADSDRLSHHVVSWPTPNIEFEICWKMVRDQKLPVTAKQVANAIHVWNHMRQRIDAGQITVGGSTRSLKRFVSKLGTSSPESAFQRCFQRVADETYRDLAVSLTAGNFAPDAPVDAFTWDLLTESQRTICEAKPETKAARPEIKFTLK